MFRSRRLYLSLVGVVTCSTTATHTVLSILDATSSSAANAPFVGLSITSAAFNVVSLCCIGIFAIQYTWKRDGIVRVSRLGRQILASTCVVLSVVALAVSLATLVTIKKANLDVGSAASRAAVASLTDRVDAHFAIWALACLSQIVLFTLPLWATTSRPQSLDISPSGPRDSVMSEIRNSNQMSSLHILEPVQPASPLAALPSPTFSTRSSQSLKSWRDSLQHVVRPVTSRTKLIHRPSFNRDAHSIYSDGQSSNLSQSDGFETWDTSDAVLSGPSRGTVLEPIPGSRPPSPADALDGPFPEPDTDTDLVPPPKMIPDTSRPPSPAMGGEAHIHPLFRTESPTPPPAATPGTSIVASPLSSQMITCPPRPYSRMRSNSRAGSPSPLVHSQSYHSRATSPQSSSRSPSPPSREMTPPIPDFVLNSSPRSSMSGRNSKRKVTLQIETGR
ncbi:hypothetical protein EJ04DRAFT_249428 [Polyplosphaeria fusca]|uniref:Uncharacterized protein n=1 Tax=Polyplosphaeria fusca TaxID=682080 RepID=A0A9P4QZQ1_9PLEO|nr:hypothetical protein EJ04DRAFT_249428 [Polyplosphaeria fusca]